jgi:hypothetical protein
MDLERFDRQLLLFGRAGQEKIAAAHAVIAAALVTASLATLSKSPMSMSSVPLWSRTM